MVGIEMKYQLIRDGLVDVGDVIQIESFVGKVAMHITRVTKTLALSKRESDGYEHKYKRVISRSMATPYIPYNTNTYRVYRPIEDLIK